MIIFTSKKTSKSLKTSRKFSDKSRKSLKTSRKISDKSKYVFDIDLLLKKINLNNFSLIDKIRNYINKVLIIHYEPQKVKEVLTNIKPLKIKSGSGASFGIYNDTYIVKLYNYKFKKIIVKKNCFYLTRIMNEVILSLAISDPGLFNTVIDKEYFNKEIKPYTNYIIDIANNDTQLYLMTRLLKVTDKINKTSYSDLLAIISKNHIPNLNSLVLLVLKEKLDQIKIKEAMNQYDSFMVNDIIKPFVKIIRYYQKNLGFIHSDLKINNIFITEKSPKDTNIKYNILHENNIITNFIPVLSDFDNSSINLGKLKILPQRYLVNKIIRFIPNIADIVDDVRYNCEVKFGESICPNFKLYNFDLLSMMVNLLFELYKLKYTEKDESEIELRQKIKQYFPQFINFWMTELEINSDLFEEIMKQSYIHKGTNFYNINHTIKKACSFKIKK
jgi:hypothetical protein